MEITFTRPLYLTFLLAVPFFILMHFLILKHIRRRSLNFANFEVIQRATGGQILNKNITILVIRLMALVLLILSTAGTTLWYMGEVSDADYVITIDASSSMLAADFSPDRLSAAKEAAQVFVDNLPARAEIGVVSFGGTAEIELTPSLDRSTVKEKINEIEPQNTGGTDIATAIVTSTNLLIASEKAKVIVLLTDGQSTAGQPIEYGIDYANKQRVAVFTIGMATKEGGTFQRIEGVSMLDEGSLLNIAQATGGRYYPATDEISLANAYEDISVTSEQKVRVDLQLALMLAALFLLFVEWGLINTKFRTMP